MKKPRLGFVGLGWIGRKRLEAVARADVAEICVLQDVSVEATSEAHKLASEALICASFDDVLAQNLDGVVIATPNRFHSEQAIAALKRGVAVFCQKPLGRTATETRAIVTAAQDANRLLGVDLSYRKISAMRMVSSLVETGTIGKVFAVDAKFHNAYGPDKPWFYDFALAGGGCVLDLGVHLIDLALEPLHFPRITRLESAVYSHGAPLQPGDQQIEDYAVAMICTADDTIINLSCSWNLHAGRDVDIELTFYGTGGAASLRNVDGSFFNFTGERFNSTETETLTAAAEHRQWDWGGLATLEWVNDLASERKYDANVERLITVAETIDRIYGRT